MMAEGIDVISIFRKKTIRPVKFKYAGRTHRITKLLYTWVTREGSYPVHHFSVLTQDGNRFELSLSTYTMAWALESAEVGV